MADDIGFKVVAMIDGVQSSMDSASESVKGFAHEAKESFEELKESAEGLKSAFELIGIGLGITEMVDFGKEALEAADNLFILSQRTGIAAETLSALNTPLLQNGSNVQELGNAMRFMSKGIEDATPAAIAAFDNLGLSITKLKTLSPEEQFFAITQQLGGIKDQSELTATAIAIFGRGAQALIPIIKETGGNIGEMTEKIKEQGGALTNEQIEKVHEYDDKWIGFWENMKVGAVKGTVALANFFEEAGKGFDDPNLPPDGKAFHVTDPTSTAWGSASTTRPDTVNSAAFMGKEKYGPNQRSAAGNNDDLAAKDSSAADDAEKEQEQLDKLALANKLQMLSLGLQGEKDSLDAEVAAGKITAVQKYDMLKDYETLEFEAADDALAKDMNTWEKGTLEYQQTLDKRAVLAQKYQNDMAKLSTERANAEKAQNKALVDTINRSFDQMLNGILQGTQTWKQAMTKVFDNLALAFVDDFVVKSVTQWAVGEATKLGITKAFNQAMIALGLESATEDAAGQQAIKTAANVSNVTADSAVTFAGVFANLAPLLGPAAAGPAAASQALVLAQLPAASAAGGFDIPAGVNPVTQLHAREMVLPAELADNVRNMTGSGGDTHYWSIQAIDGQSAQRFFMDNGNHVAASLRKQARNANPNLANFKV